MSDPTISAVIVAWNSASSLPASLRALRRSAAAAGVQIEIVVVDNASDDDSTGLSIEAGVDRIIENPLNAGYVVAASQGISVARGSWVMLANPDLTVSEPFVGAMLGALATALPDVACLVPDIRYSADPAVVNSRGLEVDEVGIPAEVDAGRAASDLDDVVEVFGPSTSGCLLRRSALADVGGLEPLYFAYLEDVDLAWRFRKLGYRSLVVPGAIALHEGSASTGEGSWLKAFLVARNRRALFRLHGPSGVRTRLLRGVTEVGHATVQALSGSGTASIRGRFAAVHTRRYTRFLRASNRLIGIPDDVRIPLATRQSWSDALRRKRSASSLMSGDRDRPSSRSRRWERDRVGRSRVKTERPLQVLVDATNLKPGQGGIRTYTVGLIEALAARPELSLVVASSVDDVSTLGPIDLHRVSARTQGVAARALWRERNLAALARSIGADVCLTPVPELPLRRLPVPSVIVVHDVGPLVAPSFYSIAKRVRYEAFLRRTCRAASAVVCVSRATLEGLQAEAGIELGRCSVIGEGPQLFAGASDRPIGGGYLLYVGSLDPRKNVDTLVEAFAGDDPSPGGMLLLVGPAERGQMRTLRRNIARLGAGDRVHHLGFVSADRLASLYRSAEALVLPSLYEGFGLPVLEAMKSGTPVIASDIPPLREVAGDAALFVSDPLDVLEWRAVLKRVVAEGELRAELSRRGDLAAAEFSWQRVGASFSELLHRVAGTPVAPVSAWSRGTKSRGSPVRTPESSLRAVMGTPTSPDTTE